MSIFLNLPQSQAVIIILQSGVRRDVEEWRGMPEVTHWQGSRKLPALGSQSLTRDTSSYEICVLVLFSAGLRGS